MRQLTVSQKKLLDKALIEYNDLNISSVDDLPLSIWDKLVEINDTEILDQEVNRYLNDKFWENKSKRESWVEL